MNNIYFQKYTQMIIFYNEHFTSIVITIAALFAVIIILNKLSIIEKLILYRFYLSPILVLIASFSYFYYISEVSLDNSIMKSALSGIAASILVLFIDLIRPNKPIVRFGKLSWNLNDFCRGWSITGRTGSGKTASAIMRILHQLFINCPKWGGLTVDEKGNFHEILSSICKYYKYEDKLITLQVKPEFASPDWKPKYRFNLLSYPGIPWSAYAKIIVDTASSLGQESDKSFFKTQAQIHIAKAMEFLEVLNIPVTLSNIAELLKSKGSFIEMTKDMTDEQSVHPSAMHFADNFLDQPEEQQGAVTSTIYNYLHFFNEPDLKEIFCSEDSNVKLEDMDNGHIFCISLPQKFQVERKYINTFMKFLYYTHALRRFDLPAKKWKKSNLLVFFADEAQGIVTSTSTGMEDSRVVDKIREAKATVVFATQSTTSYKGVLKPDNVKVLLLNLSNQIYYTLADSEAAKLAADILGSKEVVKRNYSYSHGNTSTYTQKKDEPIYKESMLVKLKKFNCIIKHCEGNSIKTKLPPVNAKYKRPSYYRWYNRILG